MKKFYLLACAGLLFAACSSEDGPANPDENQTEAKYMAVNIVASNAGTTKADDGVFSDGDATEYAISNSGIVFYFFDQNGNAFPVDGNNNFKSPSNLSLTTTASDNNANITVLTNKILVLDSKTGDIPSKVVAVVNANFTPTTMSLTALNETIVKNAYRTEGSTNYFMMTNSVYHADAGDVYATPITAANISTSSDLDGMTPVNIYVERVVAKVSSEATTLTALTPTDDNSQASETLSITVQGTNGKEEITPVKVAIKGWYYFDNATQTTLLKDISNNATWTVSGWNDKTNYRSYWATTQPIVPKDLGTDTISYVRMKDPNDVKYTFENTTSATSVIFGAQLQKEDGTPLTLVRWLSQYYTLDGFKQALANYLAYELCTYDATTSAWTSIQPEDLEFTAVPYSGYTGNTKLKDYNVVAVLSETGKKKEFYPHNSTTKVTDVQAVLDKVPTIQIWNNGMCYYYTEIVHNPVTEKADGSYPKAIVRNHWYQLAVKSIAGLGTPVYNMDNRVDPKRPEDENWYLATTLNVLAWRNVKQDVNLTSK